MLKFLKANYKTIDFWFFLFFGTLVLLPIIAPILTHIGLHEISQKIYLIYSFTCHQFSTRSIHILDHQYAWCARDTGIWLGFLAAAVLYRLKILKPISIFILFIFVLPIALDGGIQTLLTFDKLDKSGILSSDIAYTSNNLFRFITGSFFGIGISLFLTPLILQREGGDDAASDMMRNSEIKIKNGFIKKQPMLVLITMIFLFVTYFGLVQLWSISSHKYEPTNVIDSIPKIQEGFFFQRRQNGECPTNTRDVLEFGCLL